MSTTFARGTADGRGPRFALPLMALTVFIDLAAFALVLPMLPFWAERFGAGPFAIGMLLAAYSITQFVFTPILGGLSDRYGRRPVIVGALLLEAAGLIGTAVAGSVAGLLVARAVGGIGGSSIGSAQAVVADVTDPAGRARGMGIIGAAIGLGFVVGPIVGGALTIVGPAVPFWAAAVLVLADAALVVRLLPETRRLRPAPTADPEDRPFYGRPSQGRPSGVLALVTVTLLATLAFTAMETVFPLFTQDRYGWGPVQNGLAFALIGVIMVVVQGLLVGRGARRFGERRLLIGGLVLLALGLAILPLGHIVAWLVIAAAVVALGIAIVNPTTSALLSLVSPPSRQGRTLGLARSAGSLGRIVGPAVAGTLFARVGGMAPFALGAVLGIGAASLLLAGPVSRATSLRTATVDDAETNQPTTGPATTAATDPTAAGRVRSHRVAEGHLIGDDGRRG